MLPSATELVWFESWRAQGGYLRLSPRAPPDLPSLRRHRFIPRATVPQIYGERVERRSQVVRSISA